MRLVPFFDTKIIYDNPIIDESNVMPIIKRRTYVKVDFVVEESGGKQLMKLSEIIDLKLQDIINLKLEDIIYTYDRKEV